MLRVYTESVGSPQKAETIDVRRRPPAVAVMPFDNLSSAEDRYFSDGITEDIITSLSRFAPTPTSPHSLTRSS